MLSLSDVKSVKNPLDDGYYSLLMGDSGDKLKKKKKKRRCRKFLMSMMIMMEVCISRILQGWPKRELVKNTFRGIRASLAHSGKTEGADSSQTVSAKQVLDKQKVQAAANLPQLKLTLYVRWGVIERLDLHRTRKRLVVCYMPTEVSGEIQFSDCLFSTCTEIYRSMNIHSLRLPDTRKN